MSPSILQTFDTSFPRSSLGRRFPVCFIYKSENRGICLLFSSDVVAGIKPEPINGKTLIKMFSAADIQYSKEHLEGTAAPDDFVAIYVGLPPLPPDQREGGITPLRQSATERRQIVAPFAARFSGSAVNDCATPRWHNLRMSDRNSLTLRRVDKGRSEVTDQHLTLTKGQRFKMRAFLAFAKLLRWCRLV